MIVGRQTKSQEKSWYKRVARYANEHGAFPNVGNCSYQIHHIKGRSFVHRKVACGGWAIIPIETQYHDVHSNNPLNVTHYPKRYESEFGTQRDQFLAMCAVIRSEDGSLPFIDEVLHAIGDL